VRWSATSLIAPAPCDLRPSLEITSLMSLNISCVRSSSSSSTTVTSTTGTTTRQTTSTSRTVRHSDFNHGPNAGVDRHAETQDTIGVDGVGNEEGDSLSQPTRGCGSVVTPSAGPGARK